MFACISPWLNVILMWSRRDYRLLCYQKILYYEKEVLFFILFRTLIFNLRLPPLSSRDFLPFKIGAKIDSVPICSICQLLYSESKADIL